MTGNCLMGVLAAEGCWLWGEVTGVARVFRNDLSVGVGEALSFCGPDEMCDGTLRGTPAFEDE